MSVCVSVKSVMSVCECDECDKCVNEERMSDKDFHWLREKRWCSIMSRVGQKMKWKMGEDNWREFMEYTRVNYFHLFCSSVLPCPVLHCVGCPNDCPRNFRVTNVSESSYVHCDHVFNLSGVLDHW